MSGFGSPCGACKFLRRKCVQGCIFAPYFSHEQGAAHFAAIHKVFGASNASKLLAHLPAPDRSEAALTISYEAQARLQDPIYGCVSHIFALQQQVSLVSFLIWSSFLSNSKQSYWFVNFSLIDIVGCQPPSSTSLSQGPDWAARLGYHWLFISSGIWRTNSASYPIEPLNQSRVHVMLWQ